MTCWDLAPHKSRLSRCAQHTFDAMHEGAGPTRTVGGSSLCNPRVLELAHPAFERSQLPQPAPASARAIGLRRRSAYRAEAARGEAFSETRAARIQVFSEKSPLAAVESTTSSRPLSPLLPGRRRTSSGTRASWEARATGRSWRVSNPGSGGARRANSDQLAVEHEWMPVRHARQCGGSALGPRRVEGNRGTVTRARRRDAIKPPMFSASHGA